MRRPGLLVGHLLVLAAFMAAQLQGAEATTALDVGKLAPEWTLTDQNGAAQSLTSLTQDHDAVAIVFHRSADW